eukprot:scaffold12076_cov134-Isochrysis_galbana.AAC.3
MGGRMSVPEPARLPTARYEGEGCGSRLGGCGGARRDGVAGVEREKLGGPRDVPCPGDTRAEEVSEPIPPRGGGRSPDPAPNPSAQRSVPPAIGTPDPFAKQPGGAPPSYRSEEEGGSCGDEHVEPPARMCKAQGEPQPQGELTPDPALVTPGRRLHEASRLDRKCIERIPLASCRFS